MLAGNPDLDSDHSVHVLLTPFATSVITARGIPLASFCPKNNSVPRGFSAITPVTKFIKDMLETQINTFGCFLLLCSFYCVDPLSALIMTTSYDITLNPSKGGFYSLAVLGSGHLTSLVAWGILRQLLQHAEQITLMFAISAHRILQQPF